MLAEGQHAPDFTLNNEGGKSVSLSGLKGKKVVVYFYPKDNTPGCTIEAKEFSDRAGEFDKNNTVVLGISKDSVQSHQQFCSDHALKVTLLSDPDMKAIEPYGVWQEKTNYGRKYMGIARTTYLIDEKGIIRKVWKNVTAPGHAQKVLEEVKK